MHKFEPELCVGCSMRLVILISDPGFVSRGCLIDLPARLTFHFSSLGIHCSVLYHLVQGQPLSRDVPLVRAIGACIAARSTNEPRDLKMNLPS